MTGAQRFLHHTLGDGAITIGHRNGRYQTTRLSKVESPTLSLSGTSGRRASARVPLRRAIACDFSSFQTDNDHHARHARPAGPQQSGSTRCQPCLSCTCSDKPGRGRLTLHPCQLSSDLSPSLAEIRTQTLTDARAMEDFGPLLPGRPSNHTGARQLRNDSTQA